jgi:hypothetical protein
MKLRYGDVQLWLEGNVVWVAMQRPPYNYFDAPLVGSRADAY